jgi:hypothetical protein
MSDKDYCIRFRPENLKDGEEVAVYLPYNDNYKPITEAIINVCSLFSDSLKNKEAKHCTEEKKTIKSNGVVLVVCNEDERAKMIKHPDCYWSEPKELSIKRLVDPSTATKFSEIVWDVYDQLMSRISHR